MRTLPARSTRSPFLWPFAAAPRTRRLEGRHAITTPRLEHLAWCCLTIASTALANTPPPVGDFTSVSYNATAKPVDGMKMGSLNVELEGTTLGAIREAIGA